MTQSCDPTPCSLTHSPEIRKTVAGRALPAPVNRVWGVYDPHPFSRFIFDPPIFPPRAAEAVLLHLAQDGSQSLEPVSGGRTSVFRSKSDTGAAVALRAVAFAFVLPPMLLPVILCTPQLGISGWGGYPEHGFSIISVQHTHIDMTVRLIRDTVQILI